MSKLTRLAAASMLFLATAAPAAASTLPELGLKAKKQAISIGFLDAAYDLALSDQLSAGVNASIGGGGFGFGGAEVEARATYLLAQPMPGLLVGATGGVGIGSAWGLGAFGGFAPSLYAGPTVRWQVPVPLQKGQQVLFRATIPLTIPLSAGAGWGVFGGGAELAWRYNANEEWVLGGGTSIIGWRKIY
jgi:hypothetical protein